MPLVTKPQFHLREFIRTGMFGPVRLGMKKDEVLTLLGKPDFFYHPHDEDSNADAAPIWNFGPLQFYYDWDTATILNTMHFQPIYVWWNRMPPDATKVSRWIFGTKQGPTHAQMLAELDKCSIPYQDTGLQTLTVKKVSRKQTDYLVLPGYEPDHPDAYYHFGTLVFKSGVMARYNDSMRFEDFRITVADYWFPEPFAHGREIDIRDSSSNA